MTLSSNFCARLVDHDELGDEHPRLAGAVDDLVVEVVDLAAPLTPGMSTVLMRRGLNAKSRTQIPSLSRGRSDALTIWTLKGGAVVRDRDRVQVGNELEFGDSGRDRAASRPEPGTRRARRR